MGRGDACAAITHGYFNRPAQPAAFHGHLDARLLGGVVDCVAHYVFECTAEQRDQIFAVKHAQRPAERKTRQELRRGREALQEAAMAETYDAQAVRKLAEQQAELMAELMVMRIATRNKIYALLAPEQRDELARLKKTRGERSWRR